jgi:hypothetical protein
MIELLVILLIFCVVLWVVGQLPIDAGIAKIIRVVIVAIMLIYLIYFLAAILPGLPGLHRVS